MMKKALFLLLIALMLACGGVEATKVGEISPTSTSPPVEIPTVGPVTYKTGDIVAIGDYELVVFDVRDLESTDFIKPDEGNKFLSVELSIVNIGRSPLQIMSITQMSVKDERGFNYSRDFKAMTLIDTNIDVELSPNENVRGFVGFQVPLDPGPLTFVFEPGLFTTGKVFIELESHLSKVIVE
jgi:hypothetical protein